MIKRKEELQIGEIVTIKRTLKPEILTGIVTLNNDSILQLLEFNTSLTYWKTYTEEILSIDSKNINVKDLLKPYVIRD